MEISIYFLIIKSCYFNYFVSIHKRLPQMSTKIPSPPSPQNLVTQLSLAIPEWLRRETTLENIVITMDIACVY